MLKTRVIPTLLWKDLGLVKGVGFNSWRRVGTVMPSIKVYNMREVDELILVDITAYAQGREPDYSAIEELCAECFVPLTFGGGIRSSDVIRRLLLAGADKVAINSESFQNPSLISEAADRFGSQCIVASIDAKKKADGFYEACSHSGAVSTGKDAVAWALEMESRGAGEILLTSVERDGTMQGYDLDLIHRVSSAVSIPVIASGGCGNFEHMHLALKEGGASAVAAASIFHFTEQTPLEAKQYLSSQGIPIRSSDLRP